MYQEQNINLAPEQRQTYKLTPVLMQSLQVLQYPMQELVSVLKQSVLENPFLDFVEDSYAEKWGSEQKDSYESYGSNTSGGTGDRMQWLMNQPASQNTLHNYLREQLAFFKLTGPEHAMAEWLICAIDNSGYLKLSAADQETAEGSERIFEKALATIQAMDPPGVGARTPAECLWLQAKEKGFPEDAQTLIQTYLDDLAAGSTRKISRAMHISEERVREIRAMIMTLNPYPGNGFSDRETVYVYPDILIRKIDDRYRPFHNSDDPTELRFDLTYYQELAGQADKQMKHYLTERRREAENLWSCITQRRETIFRIAELITDVQQDFFHYGPAGLHPLTMEQAAEALGYHTSTISRACNGKYMLTEHGTIPFKFFFSASVSNESGASSGSIMNALKELIAAEDPTRPYSDQKLSELLAEKGHKVARRTIAKYRGKLNIPDAAARKR